MGIIELVLIGVATVAILAVDKGQIKKIEKDTDTLRAIAREAAACQGGWGSDKQKEENHVYTA